MNTPRTISRRAFTLIEAITVIIIIALTVPPAVMFLDASAQRREDAVQAQRAATLGEGVMEFVLADIASDQPGLGFAALSNMPAYRLNLASRISSLTSSYTPLGFTYRVDASGLVSSSGSATGDPQRDIFRVVTVTINAPRANGTPIDIRFSTLVGDL